MISRKTAQSKHPWLLIVLLGVIFIGAGFIFMGSGCSTRNAVYDKRIVIVDIGFNDRIELGKQLRTIRQYNPKIVALDFHLLVDSLDKDSILVKEIQAMEIVQVVNLKEYNETDETWGRIQQSQPKFKVAEHGFANLTTYEDRVIANVFQLQQKYNNRIINAFSLAIANRSFGVKSRYKNTGNKEFSFDLNNFQRNYFRISNEDFQKGNFRRSDIAGKIVILGYLGNEQDFFFLTEDKNSIINGVEIHAAILNEILAEQ